MSRELHDTRVQIVTKKTWVQKVDAWRKQHPENISRSEAIRILTEKSLHESAA
jgi:metal-responsive CopG/Arc/MetJ family transcriptional regulator